MGVTIIHVSTLMVNSFKTCGFKPKKISTYEFARFCQDLDRNCKTLSLSDAVNADVALV